MYNLELINITLILLILIDIFISHEDNIINRKNASLYAGLLLTISIFNIFNFYYGGGNEYFLFFRHLTYILAVGVTYFILLKNYNFKDKKNKILLMSGYALLYTVIICLFSIFNVWSKWDTLLDSSIMNPIAFATLIPFVYLIIDALIYQKDYKNDDTIWVCFAFPIVAFVLSYFIHSLHIFTISFSFLMLFIILKSRRRSIKYDSLTNILNRYSLDNFIKTFRSTNKKYYIYFIDLNKFKQINDIYGHSKGDMILIDVSEILKKLILPKEYLFRYGGDEFIIISNYDLASRNFENELKNEFAKYNSNHSIHLEASFGVAEFFDKKQILEAMDLADKNMYEYKNKKNDD